MGAAAGLAGDNGEQRLARIVTHSAFPKQVRQEVTTCMGEGLAVRESIAFVSTAIGQFVIMKILAMGKSLSSGSSVVLQKTGAGR